MTSLDWSAQPETPLIVDGVTLEFACFGPPPDQASTIVMLHEGLGSAALWRDFPRKVAERTGMGVFVWSRQGYGQSDPTVLPRPLDYMTREAVDMLPCVLDRIGFRRGILFGHSDGATIAAVYAGSVSDMRVRGLILMAPHFFTEPVGLAEIERARHAYGEGILSKSMGKYHREPDATFYGWNDAWLAEGFRDWNVAEVIDYLRVPVLAIQGREDQYGTLTQIEEIKNRIYAPVDVAILDSCRHAPHFEQPEQTLTAVAEFTGRLERIEAAGPVPT